jgi:hypothetical protein
MAARKAVARYGAGGLTRERLHGAEPHLAGDVTWRDIESIYEGIVALP